jgi:hypothetical protein
LAIDAESADRVWATDCHADNRKNTTVSCRFKKWRLSVALQPLIFSESFLALLECSSLLQLIENELSEILFGFAKADQLLSRDHPEDASGIVFLEVKLALFQFKPQVDEVLLFGWIRIVGVEIPLSPLKF